MSRIAVRLLVAILLIAGIVASFVGVLKKIPSKQRYPIAQVDAPLADDTVVPAIDGPEGVARNVILILGDGMGPSLLEAARLGSVGATGRLEMQKLPVRGMVTTGSASDLVTDSGAAGTAIATGVKTNNRMISVDPSGARLRTILEAAEAAGFVTGLVTTTDPSDATPAAFATHAKSRYDRGDIASQLIAANVEIVMGSGIKHFAPVSRWGGRRTDGVDLLADAAAGGATVVSDLQSLRRAATLPVLGIFEESERPPLPDLAHESLRLFGATDKRFFLMLESEAIDSAAHDNDLGRTLSAVRELDQTVKTVMDWARRDASTLVIVTADHDTGGLTFIPSDSPKLMQVIWPTTAHTAREVSIYAFGPGSELFGGFLDNTDIAPRIARLLGIEKEFRAKD